MMKIISLILLGFTFLSLDCASVQKNRSMNISGLKIYSRADWNSLDINSGYTIHKISKITLHHGGVEFKGDLPTSKYLRNLQFWSRRDRPWPDLPYHFIIDLQGEIWEGRPLQFKGDTNTEYDPTGHVLIVLLGNYEIQQVSQPQLDAVVNLTAALCKTCKIDPEKIRSHKDYTTDTLCPGKNLYRYLEDGTLINQVKKRL